MWSYKELINVSYWSYRNEHINYYVNSYMDTLKKAELATSYHHIGKFLKPGAPIYNSKVQDTFHANAVSIMIVNLSSFTISIKENIQEPPLCLFKYMINGLCSKCVCDSLSGPLIAIYTCSFCIKDLRPSLNLQEKTIPLKFFD